MKLNQVVAVEKGVKNRVHEKVTDLHKTLLKGDLFSGHSKTFKPLDEDGEKFADDNKKVQFRVEEIFKEMATASVELLDIEATKDNANSLAKADVVVDGKVVLSGVQATTILFLEKQVTDFRTSVEKAPVLDSSKNWTLDANSGLFKTAPQTSHRTKKVQKAIVKYPATAEHPAQTEMVSEDVIVGYWSSTDHSGAASKVDKEVLLARTNKLLDALKSAREQANLQEATKVEVGQKLFDFLMGS